MRRLQVVGTSNLQLPAVLIAREMGLYVGITDYDPNAVAIPYADEYFSVSTNDEEGIYYAADSAVKVTDKIEMIKCFDKDRVNHPWYFAVSSDNSLDRIDKICYPCISKPTDSSGSRRVVYVEILQSYKYVRIPDSLVRW